MFFTKNKHHIITSLQSILLCFLFTGICFISTYTMSSSYMYGIPDFHNLDSDPQININQIIVSNDVIVSNTSFYINGLDPFIVYNISNSSFSGSSSLYTQITFDKTYSHDISLRIYYCTTENIIFDESHKEVTTLKKDAETVSLTLPSNITYLRLDIENAEQEVGNTFNIKEIRLINTSIWDILYNFFAYTKFFLLVGYIFIILAVLWIRMEKKDECNKRIFIVCYIAFMLLFIGKTFIYARSIGITPDEQSHIAYIVYEAEHMTEFVPHFEDISGRYSATTETGLYKSVVSGGNYLGHPPLYYKLLPALGVVKVLEPGETAYINANYLYVVNIAIVWAGILLFLYIGYTRIPRKNDTIPLHILWAAICTGVPMAAFEAVGCSNDNLLYIEFALFFLGILRYFEKKKTITTYLLVSIGMSTCLLTKLTGGCTMVIMVVTLFVFDCIQTKSMRMITNKQFCMTLPIYGIPALYFLILYNRYGMIQPSLQVIVDAERYYRSAWYVAPENRIVYTMKDCFSIFIHDMARTWSCIYNGYVYTEKPFMSFWQLPFLLLVLIALVGGIYSLLYYCFKDKKEKYFLGIASALGLILTFFYNFLSVYKSYLNSGRLGGTQGRYYLFALPAIAFLNIIVYQNTLLSHNISKKIKVCVTAWIILFIIWLLAADLPYTLNVYPTYFIN